MSLVTGIDHAAILTTDLSRLVEFYTQVFDADVVFEERNLQLSHAMVRIGEESVLHAVETRNSPHAEGRPDTLNRGHLDHLGLNVPSLEALKEVRSRLVQRNATDGAISDLGPQLSFWFQDPDDMLVEVCWIRDRNLRGFHAPEPLTGVGKD